MKRKYLLFLAKVVFILLFLILLVYSQNAYSVEYARGQILGPVLQDTLSLSIGDKAIINLGKKNDIIKGDILKIATTKDTELRSPIGQCAVLKVEEESSICEIIKLQREIDTGSIVYNELINFTMAKYAPHIFNLLFKSVESYEPQKRVKIYIYNIYDDKNNVTKYSEKIKNEIHYIFQQKDRVMLDDDINLIKDFRFYPSEYEQYKSWITEVMRVEDFDVFISGIYTVEGDSVNLTLYKIDRIGGLETVSAKLPLEKPKEIDEIARIVTPYTPITKMEYVQAKLVVYEKSYELNKEKAFEIVKYESDNDPFKLREYRMKNFNIVSPVDVQININKDKVNLTKEQAVYEVSLLKGEQHKIRVAFRRGYFYNTKEALVFISDRLIEKDVYLTVSKDNDITVNIEINPDYVKDNISFRVFTQKERTFYQLVPITTYEVGKQIEHFKN